MTSAEQIDEAILSGVSDRWTQGALVAARVRRELKEVGDGDIQSRLELLVDGGTLEASGDISVLGRCKVRRSREGERHDGEIWVGFLFAVISIGTGFLALKSLITGETILFLRTYGWRPLAGDLAFAARVCYLMSSIGFAASAGALFGKLPRRSLLTKGCVVMGLVGVLALMWIDVVARGSRS